VSVSVNILDWHSFSLLFFGAGLCGCFSSNRDYFVVVLHFNLVVLRCFTSALFSDELCALKKSLVLLSALCIIGNSLAPPFGHLIVSCLAFFCLSFCIFWTPYLVPFLSSLCLLKLLLLA